MTPIETCQYVWEATGIQEVFWLPVSAKNAI